ncbi:MAG TPA: tail fiber domain-containing protein [Puia sp.]|nr:tail fiber domain-containing protein [Puia sp.]
MAKTDRTTLKSKFKTGMRPTQQDFEDLIDSQVSGLDDGLTIDPVTKNVGINISAPKEKLQVGGAITIGNTANATPDQGTIKMDSGKFLGYTGSAWVDLGATGGGGDTFWTKPGVADLITYKKNSDEVDIQLAAGLPAMNIITTAGVSTDTYSFIADGAQGVMRVKGRRFWFMQQDEKTKYLAINGDEDTVAISTKGGGIAVPVINCVGNTVSIPILKVLSTFTPPPSDIRVKKNITPFKGGLDSLSKLNPVHFEYNGLAGTIDGDAHIGLIAQEVQRVLPEMVEVHETRLNADDKTTTGVLHPKSQELVYLAINAIKELQQQVVQLQRKVADLEERLKIYEPYRAL